MAYCDGEKDVLMPCPFCGADDTFLRIVSTTELTPEGNEFTAQRYVKCRGCGATGPPEDTLEHEREIPSGLNWNWTWKNEDLVPRES